MRRLVRTSSVAALVLLVLMSATAAASQDPQVKIKTASGLLLSPPNPAVTQAAIVSAMLDLLDVTVFLTRESQYAQDIKYRIDVAKDLMLKTSMFNEKARQYLSFAHRMTSGGKKYEKPKDLDEFVTPEEMQEKSRKYCATLVNGALAALERGQKGEAARLLLELVLAIVTPVSGAPDDERFYGTRPGTPPAWQQ
jgi:hypothetical protein